MLSTIIETSIASDACTSRPPNSQLSEQASCPPRSLPVPPLTSQHQRLNDYEDLGEIGRGQFGSVHKIKRKSDGLLMVWKKLDYQKMAEKEKRQLQQEVQLLQTLDHRNVVKYYGKINDKSASQIYLLMEYCDGGDLGHYLDHTVRKGYSLPEDTILLWFSQLVDALHYCHNLPSGKVFHRDIKPQNVLISEDYKKVKLGDFGLAKMLQPQQHMAKTHVGTPYYMSPEVLNRNQYDAKSDIWSLGCLLYEMACGRSPHCKATTFDHLKSLVDKGSLDKLPSNYSKELYSLILWMLARSPQQRPSTNDLRATFAFRLGCFVGLAEITDKVIARRKEAELRNRDLSVELRKAKDEVRRLQEQLQELTTAKSTLPGRSFSRSASLKFEHSNIPDRPRTSASLTRAGISPMKSFAQPLWRKSTPARQRMPRQEFECLASTPMMHSPFSTPLKQAQKLVDRLPPLNKHRFTIDATRRGSSFKEYL